MKIIINADDCGFNKHVNSHIEHSILLGKITSTTVMANMEDLDGAVSLYKKYKEGISFGLHVNLTEGSPLLYSQQLLDIGFYKEENNTIIFNSQPFRRKFLTYSIREEIYREVFAQAEKVLDSNVSISHIDGHHFIHQAIFMLPLLPRLCKAINVHKVRTYRNYMPHSVNRYLRECWSKMIKIQDTKAEFTDCFTSFQAFVDYEAKHLRFCKKDEILELMTHPGGRDKREEEILIATDFNKYKNVQLVNYNQI